MRNGLRASAAAYLAHAGAIVHNKSGNFVITHLG